MKRCCSVVVIVLAGIFLRGMGLAAEMPLDRRPWFETRTPHFQFYSCANASEVFALAGRLELFSEAYAGLAGNTAVASPPIVVIVFPDPDSLQAYLPLHNGKPAHLSGFFKRDSDENLIVLALQGGKSAAVDLQVIFHEYTHLLLRRNALTWPLWLNEGMAELYSSFQVSGRSAYIARPMPQHMRVLEHTRLLPLNELFAVNHDSPQYNDDSAGRQGTFYAESWLLAHYLVAGGNPSRASVIATMTRLIASGQFPEQAFTNACQASLASIQQELSAYLQRGLFTPIQLTLPASAAAPKQFLSRPLTPAEIQFRLGDELVRIDRLNDAEPHFVRARDLDPSSPVGWEGLGLLAARRKDHAAAVKCLDSAIARGSTNYLVYYLYAREKMRTLADSQDRYRRVQGAPAAEIRSALNKVLSWMPDFGAAQEELGFFEMVQGDDPAAAERHLALAVELEPDNSAYLLSLAQAQMLRGDLNGARLTLAPLLLPNAPPKLTEAAKEILQDSRRAAGGK